MNRHGSAGPGNPGYLDHSDSEASDTKGKRWCQRYTDTTPVLEVQSSGGGCCSTWMRKRILPLVGGTEKLNAMVYEKITYGLEFGKVKYIW